MKIHFFSFTGKRKLPFSGSISFALPPLDRPKATLLLEVDCQPADAARKTVSSILIGGSQSDASNQRKWR
jgi:hypothetical protein